VNWILEADITSFFDSLDRTKLKELLQIRVADGSLLRIIGKLLRVGVLDGAEYSSPDLGTAQGSALSPLLGNVVLHYVLDAWFEQVVLPLLGGRATLVRYADDFVIGFERREDAERVMTLLHERMASFGLTLHPDKTRLLPFRRPPAGQQSGKGPATFDFLGFTLYWGRARSGRWCMRCKTRSSRLQRAIQVAAEWCRRHRHLPVNRHGRAMKKPPFFDLSSALVQYNALDGDPPWWALRGHGATRPAHRRPAGLRQGFPVMPRLGPCDSSSGVAEQGI
jgi:hypothetical protein